MAPRGENVVRGTFAAAGIAGAVCALTAVSAIAESPSPAPAVGTKAARGQWAAVEATQQRLVSSGEMPGVGLRVVASGKTVYDRAFGAWTTDTVTHVASTTKMASATAVLTLVDAGKLSLSTPVVTVLPWFDDVDPAKRRITLAQLLSHTSGLPGLTENSKVPCITNAATTLEQCVREIAKTPLSSAPGEAFAYGGADFQVAGLMAQTVARQSFTAFFARRLVKPCGLNWTWNSATNPHLAGGGTTDTTSVMKVLEIQQTDGKCGDHRVLSERTTELMRRNYSGSKPVAFSPPGLPFTYGLGVWRDHVNGKGDATTVSSPGAYGTYPWVDLRHGYRAYLSTNIGDLTASQTSAAAATVLKRQIVAALKQR